MKNIQKIFTITALCIVSISALTCCYGDTSDKADLYPKAQWTDGYEHYYTPDSYLLEADNGGTIQTLTYRAEAYAEEAQEKLAEGTVFEEKKMYVYLPYDYTEEKQYDVLYLLHGSNETVDYWFYEQKYVSKFYRSEHDISNVRYSMNYTKNMLDNLIASGDCLPFIVVTPTYFSPTKAETYYGEGDATYVWIDNFEKELRNDIMPLIESKYSIYTEQIDESSTKTSRSHCAIAGFSRGSRFTTKYAIPKMLDVFSKVGSFHAAENLNVEGLKTALKKYPNCTLDFWYNGYGENDKSAQTQIQLCNTVKSDMQDIFVEGINFAAVNKPYAEHTYDSAITDLYNCLKIFFPRGNK